ncbi:MAG TPA: ABC transporter ATP-binding protein [Anaerolineae bacterium]|nr:ABC transporter ATP-binding protein [Anaerolineae bacterium]HIQ04800.1 ABC transporter ATP-binding protein [Anaerolineae bacterium]
MKPLLQVKNLRVYYHTLQGPVKAVDGVNFDLRPGERFGLIGESGSGKSTIALSLLRLIKPPGRIESGEIWLDSVNVMSLSEERMRQLRLAEIALISQGAMNSLNPVIRIKRQIVDGLRNHGIRMSREEWENRVGELLEWVGLQREVADMFPHELSGGMKQRVCIAIAISLRPKVIIADEPTSALDVVVQRQVMETLRRVQEDLGASVILIGHDMGLMAQFAHRVGVMYAGKLVELCSVEDIFTKAQHPYSQLLVASLPSLEKRDVFQGIPGLPPSLLDPPSGCTFHPRCPYAIERCAVEEPLLKELRPDHWAACHLLEEHGEAMS